jgi:hypothetical protein
MSTGYFLGLHQLNLCASDPQKCNLPFDPSHTSALIASSLPPPPPPRPRGTTPPSGLAHLRVPDSRLRQLLWPSPPATGATILGLLPAPRVEPSRPAGTTRDPSTAGRPAVEACTGCLHGCARGRARRPANHSALGWRLRSGEQPSSASSPLFFRTVLLFLYSSIC